jgi:hypothetical protein
VELGTAETDQPAKNTDDSTATKRGGEGSETAKAFP